MRCQQFVLRNRALLRSIRQIKRRIYPIARRQVWRVCKINDDHIHGNLSEDRAAISVRYDNAILSSRTEKAIGVSQRNSRYTHWAMRDKFAGISNCISGLDFADLQHGGLDGGNGFDVRSQL